jgi:hypothetical protein
MSWLPSASTHALLAEADVPWVPPSLERSPRGLRHVFVDEILDGVVGLALCDWPSVDADGRLRFKAGAKLLGADRAELRRFLMIHRRPRNMAARAARIGDVFGVEVDDAALASVKDVLDEQRRLDPLLRLSDWVAPPIYDLTTDARDVAKISFYAAVAPTLTPAEAKVVEELTANGE